MFWSKLCKSNRNCPWNLAFPVFIPPTARNMSENLHYRRILCCKNFKAEGKVLKIAYDTIHLCPKAIPLADSSPWTKNPGIRPIGVGEVRRWIVGKTIAGFLKEEIKEAAGPLQVCAGPSAGSEAAIHAMSQVFVKEEIDCILLIDASNADNLQGNLILHH